ncbi:MAG: hypothetical protein JW791_04585 [Nanoarchaeota archaeon]|nr:hypothetical protein [Nanoarchaeota archaeon]
MIIEILAAFLSGLLVKTVDNCEDNNLLKDKNISVLLGALYGIILGYLITVAPLPSFWIGILLGVVFAGKIDSIGHYTGLGFTLISLLYFGIPIISISLILLISLITLVEEWVNDEIVDKNKVSGLVKSFLSIRPLLEITSIILAVIYNNPLIFVLLLSFDLGYLITDKTLS